VTAAALVTGATGFLGSHLALQLLTSFPDVVVVCLARGGADGTTPQDRVVRALRSAAQDAGLSDSVEEYAPRVIVIEDDLLAGAPAPDPRLEGLAVDAFWHCAAVVKFVETPSREVWHTNVTGLEHALTLAERLRVGVFNHVSTAYACGTMAGRIPEAVPGVPPRFNNVYEESKYRGEILLETFCGARGMHYRIIRPSIIIGHSQTFRTSSGAGFYQGLEALQGLYERTVARDPSYFQRQPLRACLDRNATLDLIPVDLVVSEMLELHRLGAASLDQVFHVTSESPVSLFDWLSRVAALIGIRIEFASDETSLSPLDRMFTKQLTAFAPYMTQRKVFDRSNVARYGADRRQLGQLLDVERLTLFAGRYLSERRSTAAAGRGV
jgi:nucleoside-diphosphate-sugar epimerase